MIEVLKLTGRLLKQTWRAWNDHDAPRIGAALAYYTAFSMAPILIIAIAVAGTVFGAEAAQRQVSLQMAGMLGETGAKAVEEMILNAHRAGTGVVATIIGAVTLLIGATTLFGELQAALNLIWNAPPPTRKALGTLVRTRLLSFGMVLVIGFLLLVSLLVSASLAALQDSFSGLGAHPVLAQAVNVVVSITATTGLFGLIFVVLPDVKIPWRDVWVGALVTSILFTLGKLGIGLYLGNSTLSSAYGAAGSFVVLLVWIYYSAQLILFGAEFTHAYAHRIGSKVGEPDPAPG